MIEIMGAKRDKVTQSKIQSYNQLIYQSIYQTKEERNSVSDIIFLKILSAVCLHRHQLPLPWLD